jgi:transcriptional regulator of acetoin/glycerol metabolism
MGLSIAPEVMAAMARFHWPGNMRQLNQVLRTAVALLDAHASQIHWAHLPDDIVQDLQAHATAQAQAQAQATAQSLAAKSPTQNLGDLAHKAIQQALENARGNVSAAARQLGISRQTLYRKLQ